VAPHFRIKWNSPLNVFKNITRVHSILYPIKQTTIGLVGFSIAHHSMQNAKCQSRGLVRGCNRAKVKGEK